MRDPAGDEPRILICGWAGAGNIGDELLTRSIVRMVRAAGGTPVVASRDPDATAAQHGVDAVPWGLGARREVADVDAVIVGPGGILQDRSSVWNLPGHLAAALSARRRDMPVAAIGVGAEPLRRRSSAALLRAALGDAPVVTRDDASTEALAAAGVQATTGIDLVFSLDLPGADADAPGEVVVAVGPAVRRGLARPAARRLVQPPLDDIAPAIDSMAARLAAPVALAGFRGARDRSTAEDLRRRLAAESRIVPDTVQAHLDAVAGARLVITSRYHAVVLAARAGVPALVVSTEPKLQSLAADLDVPRVTVVDRWADVGDVDPTSRAGIDALAVGALPGSEDAAEAVIHVVAEAGGLGSSGAGG